MAFDASILHLAEWSAGLADDVPDAALDALVWHHLDSVGCALGGIPAEPCRALRRIAATGRGDRGVSVVGMPDKVAPELAALANAAMVRYLDYNDSYLRLGGGHTSDIIPALWAVAESSGTTGADFVRGLHAGYEAFAVLADAVPLRERGWDYPLFIGIAAAVGSATVLRLPVERVANAIAMAVTPAVPLGITRAGELSNWKGLASPFATMSGLLATRLAAEGISGPPQAVEGVRGLWALVTGEFSLDRLGVPLDGRTAAERCGYKLSVAEYNAQAPVHEFGKLHDEGIRPGDIESVTIATYFVAWSEIGGGQQDHADKWDPRTRETADHSLPYLCAVALVDGRVQAASYTEERIRDPALRPIMAKIEVVEDPRITAHWVERPAHDITVRLVSGETRRIRVDHPYGHPANPATTAELAAKFRAQAAGALGPDDVDDLHAILVGLPGQQDLAPMLAILRRAEDRP
jgi:2-methylcitrate dehydratase